MTRASEEDTATNTATQLVCEPNLSNDKVYEFGVASLPKHQ
jgi:hypothetical protein